MQQIDVDVGSRLSPELQEAKDEIERIARRLGLPLSPTIFLMVTSEEISELAAYNGFAVRWPHWTFGQDSIHRKKNYRWGLGVIFEMVIPTKPCYAYLLDVNTQVAQKTVMAHVMGHNSFFEINTWFQEVPGNLLDRFGDNAEVIAVLKREFGRERVDRFLEACLSVASLLDPLQPLSRTIKPPKPSLEFGIQKEVQHPKLIDLPEGMPEYMRDRLNPSDWVEQERKRIAEEQERQGEIEKGIRVPAKPTRDILGFLLAYAPLEPWQQEVVRVIREENQVIRQSMAQTKIMDEGWAAFWETKIMAGEGIATNEEACSFAHHFAQVLSGGGAINPYRLGKQIWDDIEHRWNTGRHGRIWTTCRDAGIQDRWDEFGVFKTLFDEHGGLTESCLSEWGEFTTFLHETRNNRGFIRNAFFTRDQYATEWLCYKKAKQSLAELQESLKKQKEGSDLQGTPYEFWSPSEIQQEITRCTFYAELQKRVRQGETFVHQVSIPEEWIAWAKENELGELGKGMDKMFEVCAAHSDVTFIQEFFTRELCEKHGYYTYGTGQPLPHSFSSEDRVVLTSRDHERVKRLLVQMILNAGNPKIILYDANFDNEGELQLIHLHDGRDLCVKGCTSCGRNASLPEVLKQLHTLWNWDRPVHIETIKTTWPERKAPWYYWSPQQHSNQELEIEEPTHKWVRYTYDGEEFSEEELSFPGEVEQEVIDLLPYIPEDLTY